MAGLEGQKAPNFTLDGSDGKKHNLSEYAGKNVVLYFYPKDDTPGCTKEACGFRDSIQSVTKGNAIVLGVSRDSVDSHNQFISKFSLPFVLLSDPTTETMKAYGAWGPRQNAQGETVEGPIRSTALIGPDGTIKKHWIPVGDAEAHPSEVLKYLQS